MYTSKRLIRHTARAEEGGSGRSWKTPQAEREESKIRRRWVINVKAEGRRRGIISWIRSS